MTTYLFYDLETSGLNPCFDQVYQFAAIRTDLELNNLEEIEIEVKPTCDIIPSPMAMVTHQVPISKLLKEGVSEALAIEKIHKLFNQPGTISLGYNTLTFDDEFLRFNFYRHLLTPYTHQFKDNCCRMDLYPMLIFYYLYRPKCLNWPEINAKISFRLEHLSSHNQLADGQAHHAMVDVRATLALAKLLKQADAEIWNYLQGFFNKFTEQERHANLPEIKISANSYKIGLMIDPKLGSNINFQAPLINLGLHRHYKNQNCWLRLDRDLTQSTTENILEHTWVINKKWCEAPFILPLKPRFIRYDDQINKILENNLKFLAAHPELLKIIIEHYLEYKHPIQPNTDIDAMLYQMGFMNPQDEFLTKKFHEATPTEKIKLKNNFTNHELQGLAERYLGRFYPDMLSQKEKLKFMDYLAIVYEREDIQITDYKCKPKALRKAILKEIALLIQNENFSDEQSYCLKDLQNYLEALTINH